MPRYSELIERRVAALDRRDREAWLALVDPGCEVIPSRTFPEADVIRGAELAWDYYSAVLEPFETGGYAEGIEVVEERSDQVLVHQSTEVRGKGSGAEVTLDYWLVITFRDGKVLRDHWFDDREEAERALGMPAEDGGRVALARRIFDGLSRGDADELVALADPEVEWHSLFNLGPDGVFSGHEGTREYMRELGDSWEAVRAEIDGAIEAGDVAVLVGRIHYRGRGSGVESEAPTCWMLKFRAGKILRFHAFRDPAAALEAVGRVASERTG